MATALPRRSLLALPALLALPTIVIAQAVPGLPPPAQVINPAFEYRDYGELHPTLPPGCLSPGGAVYLTRKINGRGRAVIAGLNGQNDYPLYYNSGNDSAVHGCNGNAEIVGQQGGRGVVWDIDWSGPQFPPPDLPVGPVLHGINQQRQIAGASFANTGGIVRIATVWTSSQAGNNPAVSQQHFGEGTATAINNQGQVLVQRGDAQYPSASLYQQNTRWQWVEHRLQPEKAIGVWPVALDNLGQVAGAFLRGGSTLGFFWGGPSQPVFSELQPVDQGARRLQHARAQAIGANRMVIGRSYDQAPGGYEQNSRATVWLQAGTQRDLNHEVQLPTGVVLSNAIGVADDGSILCEVRHTASTGWVTRRAALLRPRPGGQWLPIIRL